jgi:[amino group carrier protein]-lysine/ornithine hydrolase
MEPAEFLKKTVSIKSTSGNEKEVAEFLVEEMKTLGFNAFIDGAGNAVGEIGSGDKLILLVSHIDTVPGDIPVEVKKNKLYGRGSVDAKGPMCAFIMAAAKAKLKSKVVVVGAVEEESATSKGARFIIDKYKPDFIIIGEPSGTDSITLGYKGRLLVEYRLERDLAHSAAKELGVIEDAISYYNLLSENAYVFNKQKTGIFEKVQVSIREINSGNDGLKEFVTMKIAYRLPVGFDHTVLKKYIENIKGDASISLYGEEKAVESEKNNKLVRAFLKTIRQHKLEPKFKVKTGTSDMNVLGAAFKVPMLAYGPGDSSLDHTPREHIDLNEYKKSIEILAGVLESLD